MATAGSAFDNARESIYCEGEFQSLCRGREAVMDGGMKEGERKGSESSRGTETSRLRIILDCDRSR